MARAKKAAAPAAPVPTGPRVLRVRQGTPEWLAERQHRVGGSDANVVMLASPYLTPFELWQIKLGRRAKPEGWQLARGHDLEPIIMERYMATTGHLVDPVVMVAANDWQIASLDGATLDHDRVVEAKNLDLESFELALQGVIPEKYRPQVEHNLGVTGAAVLDLACYHEATDRFHVLEITPDAGYFAELTRAEADFRECVLTQAPPAICERDVIVRDDEAWRMACAAWLATKGQIEELEATLEVRRQVLEQLAGGQNSRGCGMVVTFASRKGNVNWQAIAKERGITAAEQDAHRGKRTAYTVVQREKAGKGVL